MKHTQLKTAQERLDGSCTRTTGNAVMENCGMTREEEIEMRSNAVWDGVMRSGYRYSVTRRDEG
jgi:hypothetical protein